jgi:predicted PurR-regulated permease PerM
MKTIEEPGDPPIDEIKWLTRYIRNILLGLFLLALVLFLDFARDFVLPVVLAFLIALTFRPAIRVLARHRIPEWLAASGFITIIVLVAASLGFALVNPVANFIRDAPAYAQTFTIKLRALRGSIQSVLNLAEKLQDVAQPATTATVQEVIVREGPPLGYIGQFTGYSMGVFSTVGLTLIIAAFLMASGDLFYAKLVRVLPTLRDKKTALRIVYDVEKEVSSYLLIITGVNAALGVVVGFNFYILGMPTPLLWGVVVFSLNFVPYVGAVLGIGIAAFIAFVSFESLSYAALIPLSYAFWNGIENQFVTPLFLGRRLRLNAVAILVAVTFWTWIWGIAGTIIAVPILVSVKIFCDHLESLSGIGEFLSEKYPDDEATSPLQTTSGVGLDSKQLSNTVRKNL